MTTIKRAVAIAFVFLIADIPVPQFSFSYPAAPYLPKRDSISINSFFTLNDLWLDLVKPRELSLSPIDGVLPPVQRIKIPEWDSDVFQTHMDTTANGSNLSLSHEKGRIKNSIFFNFLVSGGGAQSLAPHPRIERGEYWQRPGELYEPRVFFLEREIPVSWKGLGPASEISQSQNIYHYFSGETRIQITDHTEAHVFYQGSDFREEMEEGAQFSLSQYAQAGGVLSHQWNHWIQSEIGYTLTTDGWEEAGYSSLTRGYGPNAALHFNLPSFFGHFKGSSVKLFGDTQRQDWTENRELSSQSFYRSAGTELQWKITKNLRLIPGFSLKGQNDIWEGESYVTHGHRSYLKLESERKWGKIKLTLAMDTPIEYKRENSNEKIKFQKRVNVGWGMTFWKRFELNHRYSLFAPYPGKKNIEERPRAMDVTLKYQLGKSKNDPSLRLHGGYLSSTLSSQKSDSEAILDGAFVLEF